MQATPRPYRIFFLFLSLISVWSFSACNSAEPQPLPTLNPVAEVTANTPTAVISSETTVMSSETEPTPDNREIISIWHSWVGEPAEQLSEIAADYEKTHPQINIEIIYQENLQYALTEAIAAGEGPDLFLTTHDQIGLLAQANQIIPITSFIDASYLSTNFEPAAAKALAWQGEVWGIPILQEGIAIIYNKNIVDSAAFPADPTDFGGLLAGAQTFHETYADKYLLCNPSLSPDSLDVYHAAPIFLGFGGDDEVGYVDDWGNVYINTPDRVAAAEWLQAFMTAAPPEAGYEICLEGFRSGEFAAWWTGPWALEGLDVDFGIQPFGRPFVHVTGLFLGANAKERGHENEAIDFMMVWADPEVQTSLALAAGSVPANRQARQSSDYQAVGETAVFGSALANGIPFPHTPYGNAQWEPLGQALGAIIRGDRPVDEILVEAQTAVETAVTAINNQ